MPIVHRVKILVNEKVIETKDFANRIAADQYADKRQAELNQVHANISTKVDSVPESE